MIHQVLKAGTLQETKGYDLVEHVKREAALRWCAAVNGDGGYGQWSYAVARRPEEVGTCISMLT